MRITWNELTVEPGEHGAEELLAAWRWLVGERYRVFLISALGDLFLADEEGRMHWLDAGAGRLTKVADSLDEFQVLRQQPERAAEWFVPLLVGDILQRGVKLSAGQCFGYIVPPALGGKFEPANFEPTDLAVHFGILGQIHEQIKDLPEGTPIGKIEIK